MSRERLKWGRWRKLMKEARAKRQECHAANRGGDGECYWKRCPQAVIYRNSCPLLRAPEEGRE